MALLFFIFQPVANAFSISDVFGLDGFINRTTSKEMALLAVQESPQGFKGSLANVRVELRGGTGRVFLDTFPLSKIDTQISTRFAKEIACKYIDADCQSKDFVYTLRSDSGIIGGPSAGAALSVLTIAALNNINLDSKTVITGTINSGGIIGPVSGLKYKIDVAKEAGYDKVLVPTGSMIDDMETGDSYAPEDYASMVGIDIVGVSDLNDAFYEFTGEYLFDYTEDIEIPDHYVETMSNVAENLCNRTSFLYQIMKDRFEVTDFTDTERVIAEQLQDEAIQLSAQAESAKDLGFFYAAASFCYGANINYRNMILLQEGLTGEALSELISNEEDKINEFEESIDNLELETLSDFEVYMIMKERVQAAQDFIESSESAFLSEDANSVYTNLAYAMERLYTSEVWMDFLGMGGRKFHIDNDVMKESCVGKLSEAQERIQYLTLFIPEQSLAEIQRDYELAFQDYSDKEYALCISKASRAKSSANVMLNLMNVGNDNLDTLLQRKLKAAQSVIIKQQNKDVFPIMGYSYYEYASSLQNSNAVSALIYSENALELSWLDIYFSADVEEPTSRPLTPVTLLIFLIGFITGCIFLIALFPRGSRRFKRKKIRRNSARKRKKTLR